MAGKGLRVVPVRCRERSRARQSSAKAQTKRRRYPGISERNRSKTRLRRGAHDSWRASASRQAIRSRLGPVSENRSSRSKPRQRLAKPRHGFTPRQTLCRVARCLSSGGYAAAGLGHLLLQYVSCPDEPRLSRGGDRRLPEGHCHRSRVAGGDLQLGNHATGLGELSRRLASLQLPIRQGWRKMVARRGPRCALDRRRLGGQVDPDFGGAKERRPNPIRALPARAAQSRRARIVSRPEKAASIVPYAWRFPDTLI